MRGVGGPAVGRPRTCPGPGGDPEPRARAPGERGVLDRRTVARGRAPLGRTPRTEREPPRGHGRPGPGHVRGLPRRERQRLWNGFERGDRSGRWRGAPEPHRPQDDVLRDSGPTRRSTRGPRQHWHASRSAADRTLEVTAGSRPGGARRLVRDRLVPSFAALRDRLVSSRDRALTDVRQRREPARPPRRARQLRDRLRAPHRCGARVPSDHAPVAGVDRARHHAGERARALASDVSNCSRNRLRSSTRSS